MNKGTWYEPLWRLLKCLFLWPIFLYIIENKREKVSSREGTIYTLFLTFSKYSRVPEQTKQHTTSLFSQSHIWVLQYLWNDVIFMPLAWWNFIVLNYLEHFISNLNCRFTRKRCLSCFFFSSALRVGDATFTRACRNNVGAINCLVCQSKQRWAEAGCCLSIPMWDGWQAE